MAWRIQNQVVEGELDFRVRGKVTGWIRLAGRNNPLDLALEGCPWRDLAGHFLRFTHSSPEVAPLEGLADDQVGDVGDMTASRKVKVPDVDIDTFVKLKQEEWTWHLKNCLYLEWFSRANGRVVIESTACELELHGDSDWTMTLEEEHKQREQNASAIHSFMDRATHRISEDPRQEELDAFLPEEDAPTSQIEAEADKEAARMDLFLDRVDARMSREDLPAEALDRIMEEERERLRRERGEPDPEPLTPEQERERDDWIETMNEICREADEAWSRGEEEIEERTHPLQEACTELGLQLHHRIRDEGWLPESVSPEHPLLEISQGVSLAAAKLAGALHRRADEPWPPEPMFAGDTLVRLKKARTFLQDSLAGVESADQDRLATPEWRSQTRIDIQHILNQVQTLIDQVRGSLE